MSVTDVPGGPIVVRSSAPRFARFRKGKKRRLMFALEFYTGVWLEQAAVDYVADPDSPLMRLDQLPKSFQEWAKQAEDWEQRSRQPSDAPPAGT
jgi:hypothetical protein